MSDAIDRQRIESLTALISTARWFGGKGRPFAITDISRVGTLPGVDEPSVLIDLVRLGYQDAPEGSESSTEVYQVPLAGYADWQPRLEHAYVGWYEDPELGVAHWYDALHDRDAMARWLTEFVQADPEAPHNDHPLTFHRLAGHELADGAHSTLFSGEQSNSSVAFGEEALMKAFRKVTPGINPDIEIHSVLTRSGSEHVAALYGWLEFREPGDSPDQVNVWQLAMLQQFLRTATDGWDLALASVRNLFAEADLHADEVGGDFAGEAGRLGAALAAVHRLLAENFETRKLRSDEAAALVSRLHQRLSEALPIVPELGVHVDRIRATYDALAEYPAIDVQRIHGDLHLGQTLRTAGGWRIVDFEGEPAKSLAERSQLDSRWRDVAGMLRSFDYAPRAVAMSLAQGTASPTGVANQEQEEFQRSYRAREWSNRNRSAFLAAYLESTATPPGDFERTLLDAYIADKAVYEAVYETRNRPAWVGIPLAALVEIGNPSRNLPGDLQDTAPEGGN